MKTKHQWRIDAISNFLARVALHEARLYDDYQFVDTALSNIESELTNLKEKITAEYRDQLMEVEPIPAVSVEVNPL